MPLFQKVDRLDRARLINGLEVKYFTDNETIIEEGAAADYFYIIEEVSAELTHPAQGQVECLKNDNDK